MAEPDLRDRVGGDRLERDNDLVEPCGPAEWQVFFADRDDLYWFDWLFHTRKGFRHCFVVGYQPKSYQYILLDWQGHKLTLEILHPYRYQQLIESLEEKQHTIVTYRPNVDDESISLLRQPLLYCVEAVKHLLGIRNFFIWTPYQLYRELLKRNATVIKEHL